MPVERSTFSADNLSAHMIGSFLTCLNSGQTCSYCIVTHSEINHKFQEDSFVLKTTGVNEYHFYCSHHNLKNYALYKHISHMFD